MARLCPLFSGSSGNSTLIVHKNTKILVDAGMSFKAINEALEANETVIGDIAAVAVTHEHSDHIKGLKTVLLKSGAKLIASQTTAETLTRAGLVPAGTEIITADTSKVAVGDIEITRFATSHDCAGSSGYSFLLSDGKKISTCTDTGIVTDEIRNAVTKSDALLFESNHDIDMLKRGPYPPELKLRILSDKGHLSNNTCALELVRFFTSGTTRFVLAHLSRQNNLPMLALSCTKNALLDLGAQKDKDYLLYVAKPEKGEVVAL